MQRHATENLIPAVCLRHSIWRSSAYTTRTCGTWHSSWHPNRVRGSLISSTDFHSFHKIHCPHQTKISLCLGSISVRFHDTRLVIPQHCHPHSSIVCKTQVECRSYKKAHKHFLYSASLSSLVISPHASEEVRYVFYVITYGKAQLSPKIFPVSLTLILLTLTIWRAPTNASKWRMGWNSPFKELKCSNEYSTSIKSREYCH